MASFTDNKGREWDLTLCGPVVKAVRSEFDGLHLVSWESPPYERLSLDPELFVDVLFFIVQDQANERSVTDVDFGRSLADEDGTIYDSAREALCKSAAMMLPKQKRSLWLTLLEKQANATEQMGQRAIQRLSDPATMERILKTGDNAIDDALTQAEDSVSVTSSAKKPDSSAIDSVSSSRAETPKTNATDSPDSLEIPTVFD